MTAEDGAHRIIAALLEARTGQQLGRDRAWRIEVALAPVLRDHGLATVGELAVRLVARREPVIEQRIVDALLNNETSFFRDAAAFEALSQTLHARVRTRGGDRRVRIWCAGCSTGQEPYSLAMLMNAPRSAWSGWQVDLVATDISASAIVQAKGGVYSQFEIQRGLGVRNMIAWFEKEGAGWRAIPALRDRVRFRKAALADPPPPPGQFDAVLCRNVMLYFGQTMRRQTLDRIADALAPGGLLMLGAGETVLGLCDRFAPDPATRGLYTLAPGNAAPRPVPRAALA